MDLPKPHKAKRMQSKASIVIEGLAGSGKSGVALLIAHALSSSWDKVWCVDTENKSLDLFEELNLSDGSKCEPFTKVDLTADYGYTPSTFLALRDQAIADGAEAFVIDSTSHSWVGKGGVLEVVNKLENENSKLNKFNAWGQQEVMDEKSNLAAMLRDPRVHCISTVRLKEKFDLVPGEGIKSRGECQVMQGDMKYEPDLLLRMVRPGSPDGEPPVVEVMKTRYAFLRLGQQYEVTASLLTQFKSYLGEGADPAELEAQQKEDLIVSITDILKNNKTKQMAWAMFKKSNKLDDTTKLANLSLTQLNVFYTSISNH